MKAKKRINRILSNALAGAAQTKPICMHYGECGGCDLQEYPYETQLRAKAEVLEGLISESRMDDFLADAERESVASPSLYEYRQRMDFVFAFGKAGLQVAIAKAIILANLQGPKLTVICRNSNQPRCHFLLQHFLCYRSVERVLRQGRGNQGRTNGFCGQHHCIADAESRINVFAIRQTGNR